MRAWVYSNTRKLAKVTGAYYNETRNLALKGWKGAFILLKNIKNYGKLVTILILVCMVVLGGVVSAVQAAGGPTVAQSSSLNGCVVEEGLVAVGTTVKEGQVLVMVRTFAGNAPAARASVDGTVVEVLVAPGVCIKAGQVVAKIQP